MDTDQIILSDFITKHPFAAAKTLESISSKEVSEFLSAIPTQKGLKIVSLMNTEHAAKCFEFLPVKQRVQYMETGEPVVIAAILKKIDEPLRGELLDKVSPETSLVLKQALDYRPNSVGPLAELTVSVNKKMTVASAIEIVRHSQSNGTELYVVDLDGIFQGLVLVRDLLISDLTYMLEDIMITTCPRFYTDQPIKVIMNDLAWATYRNIPVLDRTDKFIGILSFRSLMEVVKNPELLAKDNMNEAAGALGELFRVGITSLLQSAGK